jgi:arginyl-tRNA synthetase
LLQYSYARAKRILRKAGEHCLPEDLRIDGERGLLKSIAEFPSAVAEASKQRAPHMLAEYLLALASEFNLFYKNCPVLSAGVEREQRLLLVEAFAQTMRNGLGLLGVEPLEEM